MDNELKKGDEKHSKKIPKDVVLEEDVPSLIKDYELLIKTLTEQLDYYKKEQDILKNDVVMLLKENKQLSSYTKNLLQKTDEAIYNISNKKTSQEELIENLKNQINMLSAEKDSTMELWKTSLSTIDHLEEELRLYEGRTHGFVPKEEVKKIIIKYEKNAKQLEMEVLRSELAIADVQHVSRTTLNKKDLEINELNVLYQSSLNSIKNLEGKLMKTKSEFNVMKEKKSEMEKQIFSNAQIINDLKIKETQSKMKVNEAVHVVEAALNEKDAALLREQQLKEEMGQMSQLHSKELENMYLEYQKDIKTNNEIYNEKIDSLKCELTSAQAELKAKTSENDFHLRTMKMMEEKLAKVSTSDVEVSNKLLILEKNLETTFQKLLLSETRNIQLESENKSVKSDLTQISCLYEREVLTKETEKKLLETKVTTLQNELDFSNKSITEIANKVIDTNRKMEGLEDELKKQFVLNDIKKEKIWTNKIREIEDTNLAINRDLQNQLQVQIDFNLKWKNEIKDIIIKLETRLNQVKSEAKDLKERNKELSWKLSASEQQVEIYKERLVDLCVDVKKIASVSREHSKTQVGELINLQEKGRQEINRGSESKKNLDDISIL
nr:sodium channel and clathrin linker 1-like isoform X1 [Onthophagus taurus]